MSGSVSPLDIWNALLAAGASSIQAAGIMGNMIAESSLNPEAVQQGVSDPGYGLAQWTASSYPTAPSLVTGNPAADMASQIQLLTSTGGLQAASGSTVSQAAGNFAATYERCEYCQPGDTQAGGFESRVSNALQVAGWAASGNWPSSAGQAATTATLTTAELTSATQAADDCLLGFDFQWSGGAAGVGLSTLFGGGASGIASALNGGNISGGNICILQKSQARAMLGAMLMGAGGLIMFAGFGYITGADSFIAKMLSGIPLVGSTFGAAGDALQPGWQRSGSNGGGGSSGKQRTELINTPQGTREVPEGQTARVIRESAEATASDAELAAL